MMKCIVDGAVFQGLSATTNAFALRGGRYGVAVAGLFGDGTVSLQFSVDDEAVWSTATTFTRPGYAIVELPPCQGRFGIEVASEIYASIATVADFSVGRYGTTPD